MILLSSSRTRARRLAQDLQEEGLSAFYSEDMDRQISPGEIVTAHGYARRGFEYPMIQFVLITESEIFGKEKNNRIRKAAN